MSSALAGEEPVPPRSRPKEEPVPPRSRSKEEPVPPRSRPKEERPSRGQGSEEPGPPRQSPKLTPDMRPPLARTGVPAASGMAGGPAHLILAQEIRVDETASLAPGTERREVRRFRLAVRRAVDELTALRECLMGDPDETALKILDAHRMLLDDAQFQRQVAEAIRLKRQPAELAAKQSFDQMLAVLAASPSEYFRARAADLQDVQRRLFKHLTQETPAAAPIPRGAVVVSADLYPTDTTSFDPEHVRALVTDHGGPTSHAAILARSRGIPAVVGLGDFSTQVREGDRILVDGFRGTVHLRPDAATLRDFEQARRRMERRARERAEDAAGPSITRDGHAILLMANIEVPEDVPMVLSAGAQGIGLYRTEFFYLKGRVLPDEEGQYRAYRTIAQRLRPLPVTIRTLDAGGDKFAEYLGTKRESNPFLGVRGIRFSLSLPEIFRTQLRAIVRATAHGRVRLLLPMITSLEEVRAARAILGEVVEELRREGRPIAEKIECGAMIEVPAAVALADLLAREVDFFSIGSNDLIQYTLAVDRENEKLAYLYDPFHPAVLHALSNTIEAANRARIPVSSCGEMSGSAYGAAVLIGLGCTALSMSPHQVPEVRALVRRVNLFDLRRLTDELLKLATVGEVREVLRSELGDLE